MANKDQIQQALDQLWEKYGNTLSLLSDSVDKIESQEKRIEELESQLGAEPEIQLDLQVPEKILELEKRVLSKVNEGK